MLSGLAGIAFHLRDRYGQAAAGFRFHHIVAQQGAETFPRPDGLFDAIERDSFLLF